MLNYTKLIMPKWHKEGRGNKMKKSLRGIIALLMTAVLVFGTMPMAFADEVDTGFEVFESYVLTDVFAADAPVPLNTNFFYALDFVNEIISFGETFTVDGETLNRNQIRFLFNRNRARAERAERGTWRTIPTGGVLNIRNRTRRGGYIGIARIDGSGMRQHIYTIEIPMRPVQTTWREFRSEVFVRDVLGVAAAGTTRVPRQNPSDIFRNPLPSNGPDIEVRLGSNRRLFVPFADVVILERRILAPGEYFFRSHDQMPRWTRGAFRVAPRETVNFAYHNGQMRHIRELIADGVATAPLVQGGDPQALQPLLDAHSSGNFGSAIIRFPIPNQPIAPGVNRMRITPGRNNGPAFISVINQNMWVLLDNTCDCADVCTVGHGHQVWAQLRSGITVHELIALFENHPDGPFTRPTVTYTDTDGVAHTMYRFELRFFRPTRLTSMPGFLYINQSEFGDAQAVSAALINVSVHGEAGVPFGNNGFNVSIQTTGGHLNIANGADVTSWFTNLPAGLTATINQVTSGGSRVRANITGTPTEARVAPIAVTIPANAFNGGVTTTPVITAINPLAAFSIMEAGQAHPPAEFVGVYVQPAAMSRTFAQAVAGEWNLPATITIQTTSPSAITMQASVVWDLDSHDFDPTFTASAQTVTISGTIQLPTGVNNTANVPVGITITRNVALPALPPTS